jgi:hypothetical protein
LCLEDKKGLVWERFICFYSAQMVPNYLWSRSDTREPFKRVCTRICLLKPFLSSL